MSPNIIVRQIAEPHHSLFSLETFGINNNGHVVDESNVSKLDLKGLTNEKWDEFLMFLQIGRLLKVLVKRMQEDS